MKIEERTVAEYHGRPVKIFDLENEHGLKARLMNYGATLVSLLVPDRAGHLEDITLGYDSFEGYLGNNPYFGATVGRFANRIGGARFVLGGREYLLARNEGPNHLHGGLKGFDKVMWEAGPVSDSHSVGVRFSYLSPDGEEGYPGNLDCQVTYLLNENDELHLAYLATTDRPTHVNLTHHSYFNLAGSRKENILEHELQIIASRFTPADEHLIPTGEIKEVAGTPLDFLKPQAIGRRLGELAAGYDHNFVLDSQGGLALAARVVEPESGRVMELYTTEPGLQFYSGNFLDGTIRGKGGRPYGRHSGFCLEPQHFPDSPNKPQFPTTVLKAGEIFKSLTVFKFLVV
ncbi:MAG: galactose mutarotase [Candidatus Saccharicenans sp.]|jgi:aldose 1-epimerase|nr:galactose mutarotase [Candidatus Saccharicenans sp.]MDH7492801.1 aldose epimerase family protein [Candidatus Saccharicenans sp.]